ncbi:MAG: GTP-binding protein [Hyphomicrobiaceae bacterium]|nr:GTP-binding protein [Hyphomicrobiaceae bacterium]
MTARKIMLLGEIGVGKSSLVRRLVHDKFETEYLPTLGVDIYRYDVPPNPAHPPMSLIIWDTDGNFGEAIFRHAYMKQATAAVIVADVTRRPTLEAMTTLARGFREAFPGRYHALVVNKIDLLAGDDPALPPEITDDRDDLFLTSAKTGDNVRTAFNEAAAAIARRGF